MRKLITILIVTLTAISCGKIKDAHNTLNDIETFINERPDSALTILDSFDTSLLENKSVWAHHSLLHAQAKDKCYIDETNDSLMTQVVNYYEGKRDKEKLFKAYYYLGRIQYNAGDYAESMLSYTKAEQLIDKIDDDFIKGLLYAQLGMLHQKYYDYPNSIKAYNTAQKYYESAEKITHQYFTMLNIGYILHEQKEFVQAEKVYLNVMNWAYDNNIISLCHEAIEYLITLYDETGRTQLSIDLINSKHDILDPNSLHIIHSKAYANAVSGKHSAYDIILNEGWTQCYNIVDTVNNYFYEFYIAKMLGHYKEALEKYEIIYGIQDSLTRISIEQPLLSVKNKFLQTENAYMQLQVHGSQVKVITILLLSVILIISSGYIFVKRLTKKNLEIIQYVEAADELERNLLSKRNEVDNLTYNISIIDSELQSSSSYISTLFMRQYALLNKLTSTYYETHVCNKDMEAIYKQVKAEIERLGSDKRAIQELENMVNRHKGNIMSIIRKELPMLQEMDFRLLCYLCTGFSAKAISIFTGDSTNNIYVKKSRIKQEIVKLDAHARDQILQAINTHDRLL